MMGSDVSTILAEEISSSYLWQSAASSLERFHGAHVLFLFSGAVYESPPDCPTIFSPAIEWEQSIIEGHPTHPVRSVCFCFFQHPAC
jgi:hypothetical protein